jgi:hypothetical protein
MTMKPSVLFGIRAIRNDVGSGLNEEALSDLILLEVGDRVEHGFWFLRLSDGFAVFAAPAQDRSKWYRQKGWPCREKEAVAASIAGKYGLEISEPPDANILPGAEMHHHCEFHRGDLSLIVAHPRYLKILVPERPVLAEETLLEDLSALYKPTEKNPALNPLGL